MKRRKLLYIGKLNKKHRIRGPAGTAKNVFVRLTEDLLRQFGVRSRGNKKHCAKLAEGGRRRKKYCDSYGPLRGSKTIYLEQKKRLVNRFNVKGTPTLQGPRRGL